MNMQRNLALAGCILSFTLIARLSVGAEAADVGSPANAGGDTNDYIEYQLRPGEDPGKVARMFHVTLAELLAANHISDPRRISSGVPLRIPDPRAAMLAQMRTQKDALAQQVTAAQTKISAQEKAVADLESQVTRLRGANRELQRDEMLFKVWQAAVLVSAAMALLLGVALFAVRTRVRMQAKRLTIASKQIAVLQAAVDKYRQLGAQFELRYQNLFHQVSAPGGALPKAQDLRRTYEDDCAQLDAIVAEAEREISAAVNATAEETPKQVRTALLRLNTARRSSS
jgi:LysM repeat protein